MDHGVTWDRFDPSPTAAPNSIWDVVALPGGRTYACGADGLLVSLTGDAGAWKQFDKPNPGLGNYCSLAVAPDDPLVVFAAFATPSMADIVVAANGDFFEGQIQEPAQCPDPLDAWCPTMAWGPRFPYPDDDPKVPGVDKKNRVPIVATNDRSPGFDESDPSDLSDGFDLWIGDGSLWRIPCHAGQTPRCTTVTARWKGSFTDHLGRKDLDPSKRLQMAHGDSGDLEFDPHATTDACPLLYSSDGGIYKNALGPLDPDDACQTPDFRGANAGLHAYYLRTMAGFSPTVGDAVIDEDLYFGTQDNGVFYTDKAGGPTPQWEHFEGGDVVDVAADGDNTVSTVPGMTLRVGNRGYKAMKDAAYGVPGQPLWDSETVARADTGRYFVVVRVPFFLDGVFINRGVRDVDLTKIDTMPMGEVLEDAEWPTLFPPPGERRADDPCHIVVSEGPAGPVPYVLAGRCWYGTQDIGWPATGPADQLWTLVNGAWVERRPGPRTPGGSVATNAGFGLVAVDPKNALRLYAAVLFDGDPRMMRSIDGGVSWVTDEALTRLIYAGFLHDLRDPGDGVKVIPQATLVAFDPDDPDIIVAGGRATGIFISSDGGQSWAVVTDPHDPGASKIPHLPNPAWARFDHDQPGVVRMYLGTGRGIWRIDLANADLSVTKADSPDPVIVGNDLTYTIAVSNAGPDIAQNATVEDVLPAGTTFRSIATPAGWSCEMPPVNATGTVRCTKPSMAPGSATFSLVVRVGAGVSVGTGVVDTVSTFSAAIDPGTGDNSATAVTEVIVPVAVNISPGGFPNSVNRRAQATVAVLTTAAGEYGLPIAFDGATIVPLSVRLGPASVVLAGGGTTEVHATVHLEDAYELDETTRDGDLDAILHFRVADAGLTAASHEACVSGVFGAGYRFFGCDSIVVVP
jgi:uncharacterized repeat protein (TIGR01451 family)